MNEFIIETEKLSFVYEDYEVDSQQPAKEKDVIPALEDVSVRIKRGEYVSVLGHNGSGKSTFAKLLNLILTPTSGRVIIDGKDVTDDSFDEDDLFDVRRKVGMVFQNPDNQLVATVVEEDVAFGPENLGLPREEIRARVDMALSLVGMSEYMRHAPHKLSGGQKQRVAIAGIIAMKPEVIIFDEATAMLDPIGRREVLDIVDKLNKVEGITVINITHYMDEAARAGRVIVINDGKLILDGAPKEVFSQVEYLHSVGLESPQPTELASELIKEGFDLPSDVLSESECVDALLKMLKKGG